MSTFSETDQRYYTKGQTFNRDEVNAIAAAVPSGNQGPATTATNPGSLISGKTYSFTSGGTYANFKDATNTAITIPIPPAGQAIINGVFYCNGTYWTATYTLMVLPTVDVTGKEDKANKATSFTAPDDTKYPSSLAIAKNTAQGKVYNQLYPANYTDGTFTGGHTTDIPLLTTPPGILPVNFINKAIGVSSALGTSGYVTKLIAPIASTDRFIYGAWFNTTQTFAQSGVASIGWYHQYNKPGITFVTTLLWTAAQIIAGATKVSGVYTSTIEAVAGDWAYISLKNTGDMDAAIVSMNINAYVTGTATTAAYNYYFANITLLMGESTINPYVYYDNASFGIDTAGNAKVTLPTIYANGAKRVTAGKYYNLLNDYNNSFNKWSPGSSTGVTISNATPPGVQPYAFIKNALVINGAAGKSAYAFASIPGVSTDRYIYGGWINTGAWAIAGVSTVGFYGQVHTSGGTIVASGSCLIGVSSLVAGKTYTAGVHKLTVEAVAGDWAYLSMQNTADNNATTDAILVNPYITATGTSGTFQVYWTNFTFLKGIQTIDPWMIYDNAAFPATGSVSPLNGKKLYVEGDSIMAQGLVTANIVLRTGAILTNTAVSGNTWAVNASGTGSMVPRLSAITPANADVIMIACATNDWGKNSTFGSFTSRSNTAEFYSSLYNGLLTLRTNNPQTPILLVLPSQRYYQGTGPDGTNRPNTNAQGKTLLDYVNAMKEVAALFSIKVADLYSEGGFTYENIGLYTSDGLHPNATGALLEGAFLTNKLNALSFI